jgi:hypothetical protein
MELDTAGWSGLWTLALVFFVVIPSIRWSVSAAGWGMKNGKRWGRYYARHHEDWGLPDFDRPSRTQWQALRDELDGRIADVDALHTRVAELENRLDFAERLLAERHDRGLIARESVSS